MHSPRLRILLMLPFFNLVAICLSKAPSIDASIYICPVYFFRKSAYIQSIKCNIFYCININNYIIIEIVICRMRYNIERPVSSVMIKKVVSESAKAIFSPFNHSIGIRPIRANSDFIKTRNFCPNFFGIDSLNLKWRVEPFIFDDYFAKNRGKIFLGRFTTYFMMSTQFHIWDSIATVIFYFLDI